MAKKYAGETGIAKLIALVKAALSSIKASAVTFEDGQTFQQKLDAGELTGPPGADGAPGKDGATGLPGPPGKDGAAGPNTVSTDTATNINGLLKGNGSKVAAAVAGTDYAKAPVIRNVTLPTAWGGNAQTVDCAGIVEDETAQIVDIAPKVSDFKAYMDAGIYVSGVAAGKLTFTCETAPGQALTVYVSIQDLK